MTVLTPTKDDNAVALPSSMQYVDPEQQVTPEQIAGALEGTGVNAPFAVDLMSACIAHERCGRHLYRSCEGRTHNPVLQAKYREFGAETERHVEILEALISSAGGNPCYVSALARAVEGMNTQLLQSTFMMNGAVDPMTAEMAMLDAVFLAETIDHANWKTLGELAAAMDAGDVRDALQRAVDEVEQQEDEHLAWARDTREKLTMLQARSTTMATAAVMGEELVARIRNWFAEG